MEQSNKTSQMWKDATMVAKAKPSPLNGFDLFNYMAAIVTNRGTKAGYEVFKRWKEELEEKAAAGLGPWKPGEEEKFRVTVPLPLKARAVLCHEPVGTVPS